MSKKKLMSYVFLIVGVLTIALGTILVIYSFKHEVLDGKYIIKEVSSYTPKVKDLKKGEIGVSRFVKYISNGEYKVTYQINYNREDLDILFSNRSDFSITDVLGDSYELSRGAVLINNESIKLYNHNTITSDYKMSYVDNTFEISFPVQKVEKYKEITIYIKLKGRDVNKKHFTSKEAYYSFVPNNINDFYYKKSLQSYIIDGYGYILLEQKQ